MDKIYANSNCETKYFQMFDMSNIVNNSGDSEGITMME